MMNETLAGVFDSLLKQNKEAVECFMTLIVRLEIRLVFLSDFGDFENMGNMFGLSSYQY